MSTIAEIIQAAEHLDSDDFIKLREALDEVEEKIWDDELARVSAKHRKRKLTDDKIDELVLRRRYNFQR